MKHSIAPLSAVRQNSHNALLEADHARFSTQGDPHHSVTLDDIYQKLMELISEFSRFKTSKKAIRLPGVKELTGESRSQIYARMNPKYAAYDKTWPLPFHIGKSPRWWLHEVETWLEAQSSHTTTARH